MASSTGLSKIHGFRRVRGSPDDDVEGMNLEEAPDPKPGLDNLPLSRRRVYRLPYQNWLAPPNMHITTARHPWMLRPPILSIAGVGGPVEGDPRA